MNYAHMKAEIVGMAIYGPLSPAQMFWMRWTSREWHQQTAVSIPARDAGRQTARQAGQLARKQAYGR